jgi:hypothetical protein
MNKRIENRLMALNRLLFTKMGNHEHCILQLDIFFVFDGKPKSDILV